MDNLEEKIERLTALFQTMETPTQYVSDNELNDQDSVWEEPQDLIYDYSSDENPYDNPYYMGKDDGQTSSQPNLGSLH